MPNRRTATDTAADAALATATASLDIVMRSVVSLHAHPRNYRRHPERQLEVVRNSLRIHGQQKPLVIQPDNTVLAGHAVLEAARAEGWTELACHVYTGDQPEAFLIMDNRSQVLAEDDWTDLSSLLADVQPLAAGYTQEEVDRLIGMAGQLGGLDRPEQHWQGLPEFASEGNPTFQSVLVHFETREDRDAFIQLTGCQLTDSTRFTWYPYRARMDRSAEEWRAEPESEDGDSGT